jgi:hypothetical protein
MPELKEMCKIVKTPEEKQYLICIAGKDGAEDEWEIVTGRTAAYEKIKNSIEFIDLEHSFILVETCTLDRRKSIYAFMKYAGEFYNDGFDIEDFVRGDWNESDYRAMNDMNESFNVSNSEKISMQSIMDGEVGTTALE